AADFAIYTPGSNAGLPVSILKSFAAPPAAVREDAEALGERIGTTVTSLLGLVGVEADPVKSREHILVSTILRAAWSEGRDLDLAGLIQQIQTPPVKRVGGLAVGPGLAPGGPDQADQDPAGEARRGARRGVLLPVERPLRPGHDAEQS